MILAAGKGTRMKSERPKVVHTVAGRAMVCHVAQAAREAGASPLVTVVGHGAELVRAALTQDLGGALRFAVQREQRGTGHAVKMALPALRDVQGDVLLLVGDMPLLRAQTLRDLAAMRRSKRSALVVGTVVLPDAGAYGRIVRDPHGRVARIVEAKDATPAERALREINTGLYAVKVDFLRGALPRLRTANAQGEYYLTDIVAAAARAGGAEALVLEDIAEVQGVNSLLDLAQAERDAMTAYARALALSGVRIAAPDTLRLHHGVQVEPGATLAAGVHLLGKTRVEAGAHIGPGAILRNAHVCAGARVGPYAVLTDTRLAAGATVEAHACLGAAVSAPLGEAGSPWI